MKRLSSVIVAWSSSSPSRRSSSSTTARRKLRPNTDAYDNTRFDNGSNASTWAASVRDLDDPTDDHGHMTLFQTGHTPNDPLSDDRDVSAAHSGIAQFLLCDGSVHPIGADIDAAVYDSLGTRAGAEVVSED